MERQEFDSSIRGLRGPKPDFRQISAVILPLPTTRDGIYLNAPLSNAPHTIASILDAIEPHTPVLCGAATASLRECAARNALPLIDYLAREELAIRNAVPTAEGALQTAMEELPITIHGARALVVGNGRIGSLLAGRLACMGANVTVSARSSTDFARIFAAGLRALNTGELAGKLAEFNVIFNTVPAPVIGQAELADVHADCLIIDLASAPGGVDRTGTPACRIIQALSLPGKVAPLSAARAIRDTIYTILTEEGLL